MSARRRHAAIVVTSALCAWLLAAVAPAASAYPRPGQNELVSVSSDGTHTPPMSPSFSPVISADGRYVAFHSYAYNLVAGDTNNIYDVFVHDLETRVTERVSIATDGAEGNAGSFKPSISADGRYVAFHSSASNLVDGDTNGKMDVFVRDRVSQITERVSVAGDGGQAHPATWWSGWPSISADGRYVAFESDAPDLVADDTNDEIDVFSHDRDTGATVRVSVDSDGEQADSAASRPSIGADGTAAFESFASNLVADDENGNTDVFVHDPATGTTERVSVGSDGTEADSLSMHATLSMDGRHVAFESWASNLVPGDANGSPDVFVHDRDTRTTELISVNSDGSAIPRQSAYPVISQDGRYVIFDSGSSVLLHDRQTRATETISVGAGGTAADGESSAGGISADGSLIAFQSTAANLVPDVTNGTTDIYVRDRGPEVGVGALSALRDGNSISVSGWATIAGQEIAAVTDLPGDGAAGAREAGGELTAAVVTYRPEQEDLLVGWRLASLPGPLVGGSPGVLYGLEFELGGMRYEVRASRAALTSLPASAPYFALYRCDSDCTEQAGLSGGIGTTGSEALVSIPLSEFGVSEGAAVKQIRAFTALGEAHPGVVVMLDDVELPDTVVPTTGISLGFAPPGHPKATWFSICR